MPNEKTISIKEKEALYSWFASLYLYGPTPELLKVLSDPETMDTLMLFFSDEPCQTSLEELSSRTRKATAQDLRNEFNSLFVVPTKRSYAPPYESCFREKRREEIGNLWGETTADVARLYREAGYEVKDIPGVFAPDHIGVELAFVSRLYADQLKSIENHESIQADRTDELRKSFLQKHMAHWIEDFARRVDASDSSSFYKYLNVLMMSLLCSDLHESHEN